MKVWIVEEGYEEGPHDLVGVASSEQKAIQMYDSFIRNRLSYMKDLPASCFSSGVTPEQAFKNEVARHKEYFCSIVAVEVQ